MGALPYVDFADNKPPLVFASYAAAQFLGDGMLPVRLLAALVLVPLVAFCASAFFGHDRRGLVAGLAFLVWSASFLGHDMLAVNCELLMLGPLALAVVALRDASAARRPSRTLVAGLLVGVATLFKYQGAAWGPALAIAVVLAGRRDGPRRVVGRLALLAIGGLLPPLAAWAVFAGLGAGDAFVYWNWTHNLAYSANPASVGETAERAAAYLLPFLLATLPLWWAAWRSRRALGEYAAALVAALLAFSALAALLGLSAVQSPAPAGPSSRGRPCCSSASPRPTATCISFGTTSTRRRAPRSRGSRPGSGRTGASARARSSSGAGRRCSTRRLACRRGAGSCSWAPPWSATSRRTGPRARERAW